MHLSLKIAILQKHFKDNYARYKKQLSLLMACILKNKEIKLEA